MAPTRKSRSPGRRVVRSRTDSRVKSMYTTEFRCRECGLRFVAVYSLRRQGPSSIPEIWQCENCSYVTDRKADPHRQRDRVHLSLSVRNRKDISGMKTQEPSKQHPGEREGRKEGRKGDVLEVDATRAQGNSRSENDQREEEVTFENNAEDDTFSIDVPKTPDTLCDPVNDDAETVDEIKNPESERDIALQRDIRRYEYKLQNGLTLRRTTKLLTFPDGRVREEDIREVVH